MNISGKYLYNKEFLNCDVTIINGKIYRVDIENNINIDLFLSNRNHSSDYELENYIDPKSSPYNSNYVLKVFGGSEKPSLVLLKLNWFEAVHLKYAMRKWLFQSDDMKKDVLKYVVGGVLGYIGALLVQEIKEYSIPPSKSSKIENQKTLEQKRLKKQNKKDSIVLNNFKNTPDLKGAEAKPKIGINKKTKV